MRLLLVVAAVGAIIAAGASRADPPANSYNPLVTFAPLSLPDPPEQLSGQAAGPRDPTIGRTGPTTRSRPSSTRRPRRSPARRRSPTPTTAPTGLTFCGFSSTRTSTARTPARPRSVADFGARSSRTATSWTRSRSSKAGASSPRPTLVSDTRMQVSLPTPIGATVARPGCASAGTTPCPAFSAAVQPGRRPRTATSTTSPSGTRAWRSMTTSAAGTRCPTSARSFTWSTGRSTTRSRVPADMLVAGSGELMNPAEVLTPLERARLAQARASDKTVMIRTADDVVATAARGRDKDLALPHGPHTRRLLRRLPRLRLGRGADQPARRQDRAGPVGLSSRGRRRRGLGPLDRIPEVRGRGVLAPLVRLPLAERDQRRRAGGRHGIPGAPVRQHERQGQDPVLPDRPRDRAHLLPDGRRHQRAALAVDGRGSQHLHRHLRVRRVPKRRLWAEARR